MSKYIFMALVAAAFLSAFPRQSAADELADSLVKDVESLKQENKRLADRVKNLELKDEQDTYVDKKQVNISGYADVEYDFTNQPGVYDHFRIRHLSLFFAQKVQKEWNLLSELEWEDAPMIQANAASDTVAATQGLLLVEQMYIQYRPGPELEISAGRILTPAGIWLIYHYPPFIPTQERPLHIRKIFPEYSDGVELRYSFGLLSSNLDAQVYVANGTGNPGSTDRNANKAVGSRFNVATDLPDGKMEYGASYLSQRDNIGIYQNSYGLHLKLNHHDLGLQSEYATRQNMPLGPSENYWDTGLYAQGTYDIKKWTLAARWDWYNSNSLTPKNDHYVYTEAVDYHFSHGIVAKAELHRHEFNDPAQSNYFLGIISVSLALGDL